MSEDNQDLSRKSSDYKIYVVLNRNIETKITTYWHSGGGGGGVTSTHNKRGCAILTKKVAPKNPEVI